ncbi:hypothetical protein GCM10012275_30210 [Longimycelium tulufanense]|uniref:Acid phosphatase n=1 Tax=Longimycelium tulufanense TaxID=907463 RepID=A0A8J3CEW0_9PSEU|nr:HAD family acid phosphatase [Longimycelium tulufanense]GGM57041.1 hypothetical protein GCM10012275_30210 [Longimycelium tulufanense]
MGRTALTNVVKIVSAATLSALLVGGASALGAPATESSTGQEPPNLGLAKKDVMAYYGDYLDPSGHHHASDTSAWADATRRQVADARKYLEQRLVDGVKNPAIVLDIDDTSELTYGWSADNDFGFDLEKQKEAIDEGRYEPIKPTRELANWAKQHGVKVFFLTGRNDKLASATVRDLGDEGFPTPDGAFFKPTTQAPDYLACGLNCNTIQYKSGTRAHIESLDNTIVLNLGDQFSDLEGGHAEKAVKLPNPMYYLP